ncbi:MAG: NTP transferase domain-containing protein [Geodermatophilaceae bacterium]|nr:NTP transferase domain-containing protein [Geodermatophilaceae bacterium]
MKAVVMAGGEGSRLRPLTLGRPKPMIPLVNKPMLSHILDLLKRHGITDIVITLQYLADRIKEYYGDGSTLGLNIEYSVEDVPLGTAGSVKRAAHLLDDTFLVISGDALTDFDLGAIVNFHRERAAVATLTLARVPNPLDYGVVHTDEEGRVVRFYEKPGWSEVLSDTVNTGIYVLEPEVLDRIESGIVCDFGHDLFQRMIEEEKRVMGYVAEGYWADVGRIEEYTRATSDALHGRVQLEPLGAHIGGNIWVGDDVEIAPDARLYGPIYLGSGVKIKGAVVIHGPAVIRDNGVVDTGAQIDHSIFWRNCYIGERVEARGAVVGMQCSIKAGALLFEGVVISENAIIRENAVIQTNVKIWPDKEVEAGATVTSSIIWGSQGRRNLFGRYGISGMVNVDLTPEFCTKLGAAFASTLRRGARVTINREAHNTPRVLKRAILSGLPAAGAHVLDTAVQPIPIVRFYTRVSDTSGGVHVRLSPYDNRVVDIRFFGETGIDLSQREQRGIETIFFREDFRRVYLDEIGQIDYPADVLARYTERFRGALRAALWPLTGRYDHIVIDYANASGALVLPDLLAQLECDVVAVNTLLDQKLLFRTRPQWEEAMGRLSSITRALDTNFGVRLDVGGERVYFAANDGSVISDRDALLAVAELVFRAYGGATIGVPITAPRALERLAARHGGAIRRLKSTQKAHMEAAETGQFTLIGDERGGFIFPAFTPFFDGLFAVAKIMELTAQVGQTLSDIWRARETYYLARAQIPCSWAIKGRAMRLLRERLRDRASESVEGLYINQGEEWVLILPDPDEPYFWIHAEGRDAQRARELVDDYFLVVSALIGAQPPSLPESAGL